MRNNQFLKIHISLLELRKDFMEFKDRESNNREEKREIEEPFYKVIIVSKEDIDRFKEQKIKKKDQLKKWYDRLIKETMMREKKLNILREKVKDKITRDIKAFFKTHQKGKNKKEA